jgi:radical SAM superfamily enzyme YgiQ (UPF0313 family)
MIIGHPDETMADIEMTKQWLIENKPDDFDVNILTPYPGSRIYDKAIPTKRFINYTHVYNGVYLNKPRYSKEDSYYKGLNKQSYSGVRTNEISNEDLKMLRNKIDKEVRECIK